MPETPLGRVVRRQAWLDPLSDATQRVVSGAYGSLGASGRVLRSLMHGTYVLGHPLHPALTDVPVGAWTVGVVADYAAHFTHAIPESAGDIALIVGLLAALLTALTGYTDFIDTAGLERRFAAAHGLIMTTVVAVETASLFLRWFGGAGLHPPAVALSTLAWVVLLLGAWYGGHVVFAVGYPVDRNAFIESGPEDWTAAGPAHLVPEHGMSVVRVAGMNVLLARDRATICALSDTCSHVGAPLHEGTLEDGVVVCPWHASRFRLSDGHVVGGPATQDLPQLLVRETGGVVEVKLAEPLHEP